jgi:hypothetical protein
MAALTGLLVSPISWDHHWVWIVPGAVTAAHYAVKAWRSAPKGGVSRRAAAVLAGGAAVTVALFGAWPANVFTPTPGLGHDSLGLLWIPKNTNPVWYDWYGDRPWFPEYHWHGLALIIGNTYVLAGLVVFGVLGAISVLISRATEEHDDEPGRVERGGREPAAGVRRADPDHRRRPVPGQELREGRPLGARLDR